MEEAKMNADSACAKAIATANEADESQDGKTSSLLGKIGSFFSPAGAPANNVNDTPKIEMGKHANNMHDEMMNPPIDGGMTFGDEPLAVIPNCSYSEFNFGANQDTKFSVGLNRAGLDKA